jgi:hypothetical protein
MRSSFQELMALVARGLQTKEDAALLEPLATLCGLRRVFRTDRDLLEAVIRRVKRALRGRSQVTTTRARGDPRALVALDPPPDPVVGRVLAPDAPAAPQ